MAQPPPLYPFGFGLSYTTFSITNLKVAAPQAKLGSLGDRERLTSLTRARVWVTRSCSFTSIRRPAATRARIRELKGFERLTLKPGETKTVSFILGPAELRLLEHERRQVDPGGGGLRRVVGADSMRRCMRSSRGPLSWRTGG